MGKRTKLEMEVIRDRYKELIYRPDFREKTQAEQARELDVTPMSISNWRREIHPTRWQQILDMTRTQSAEPTLEVDDALLRSAKGGDVAAMKLWYEIHGWSPKQNLEVTRGKDVELSGEAIALAVRDAFGLLPNEQKRALLEELGGVKAVEGGGVVGGKEAIVDVLEGGVGGGSEKVIEGGQNG